MWGGEAGTPQFTSAVASLPVITLQKKIDPIDLDPYTPPRDVARTFWRGTKRAFPPPVLGPKVADTLQNDQ